MLEDRMIKDLAALQERSKHAYFAKRLTNALKKMNLEPSPRAVATAFNLHSKTGLFKHPTVRKWLLGQSQPSSEMLLLLSQCVGMDPKELLFEDPVNLKIKNTVSFEFDFNDQEVIAKYLSLTIKEKVTVRLFIDVISEKSR